MTSVGRQIARELTAQFYRWELRGRGWVVWPDPVALEPPFRPFEGHHLPRRFVEDDGRIESFGSRIAQALGFSLGPAPIPPEADEVEEPAADSAGGGLGRIELQIALPPDHQPQANVFEQFLFSIGHVQGPVAFEVIGTEDQLVVQVATQPEDSSLVRQQLKAFFPEAVIVVEQRHLLDAFLRSDGAVDLTDFGLQREFMVPINPLKGIATDPLVGICGALDRLGEREAGIFQVLLEPARHPWASSIMKAITWGEGQPFFANDPELVAQTRTKVARPLYAVVVRLATTAPSQARADELMRGLSGALRPLSAVQGNQLIPLEIEDYLPSDQLEDLVFRRSHRPGMLLNSDELIALAHLPTAAVRARSLRRVIRRTKEAPKELVKLGAGLCLGVNEHEGVENFVRVSDQSRLNHCEILGGTGSGKSTLLSQIAWQDIVSGRGVAVIDPHGDLIDLLIPHIPKERIKDVVLFDPTDEEFAIAFNPLAASSERERDLLATDFIAVMKQNTSSWGDQMSSLLGNAVLAFLHSDKGGTLPELRRFLSDPKFRAEFLKSVSNSEVVYFWEHEAQLANKSAIGSILTRLDSLLRYESLLHILGQRANRLDFADIMDSGKIFLARLAKGLIGQENAYLLGSLLVSRFYQTTIARQARSREDRRPYFLLMDEAGDLLTSTVSEILKGTRKYGLGLTLAHQSLSQLRRDEEVYGAVTGSCGTKVCFQVGGDDARKMAEEFGGFIAADLMNQSPRFAIARVGPRDNSFNLEVHFLPEAPRPLEEAYAEVLGATRERYATSRASIRAELAELRRIIPPEKGADPFAKVAEREKKDREQRLKEAGKSPETTPKPPPASTQKNPPEDGVVPASDGGPVSVSEIQASVAAHPQSVDPAEMDDAEPESDEVRRDPNAESVKNEIIQAAGGWGYSNATEHRVNQDTGRVDILLTLGSLVLAAEISVTTSARHEVGNLKKCLQAGFQRIFYICDPTHRRRRTEDLLKKSCSPADIRRIEFVTKRHFIARLGEFAERLQATQDLQATGIGKTVLKETIELSAEDRKQVAEESWDEIARNMARDRKNRLGGK